ncbi:unnamed protein product [Rhizoctonia solani]|uniref:peptidylprolyl isomerase n=1 Tax=Rhizoctonia solani TaxID=456999 RepID=A0A8H3A8E9_9AGAM|nr:unnamed protein product [Rhizoctonia solani]
MGVIINRLEPGDGIHFPRPGDVVTIHYIGTLLDGSKFDSSRDRGAPFVIQIGLSLGEKALLTTTADYAYGERGFPPNIPSNATLNFEVELLGIN